MTSRKKPKSFAHRRLRIESLENRELLSVTVADLSGIDYESSDSAYIAQNTDTAASNTADAEAENATQNVVVANAATVYLAKPASVRPASSVTPTTLTVNWGDPVATKVYDTASITGFKVELINAKTKQVVQTLDAGLGDRSATFEGLDVKTRYQVTVTSVGGASSDKATLKITATTAAFPLVTVKASKLTLNSATLTITDKDKVTKFVDNQTVKEYTVLYAEKSKTIDWNTAETILTITPGSDITDAKKCTIVREVTGLMPGVQYSFRVVATYKDGFGTEATKTPLKSEGKVSNAKTVSLPAVTLSKSYFSVIDDSTFAIAANCKMANYAKLGSQFERVTFSLLVSTETKLDKTTGQLSGAKPVADNGFSDPDSKGVFTMNAVSLESIVAQLGREAVLGVKTLGLQLVVTYHFADTTTATSYSKVGKITLPTWYFPA